MTNPDSIPRYQPPAFDELAEQDFEERTVCEDCNWYLACGKSEARKLMQCMSPYSDVNRNRYLQRYIAFAIKKMGICARKTELCHCADEACEMFEGRQ